MNKRILILAVLCGMLIASSFFITRNILISSESSQQFAATAAAISGNSATNSSTVERQGTTLCSIPKNIGGYTLHKTYVANDYSQIGYGQFWDTSTGALYSTLTPKEDIMLSYINDASGSTTINVDIYRYTTEDDFRADFEKILSLQNADKGQIITMGRSAHTKGSSRVGVAYFGTYVEAEVNKNSDMDAQIIASTIAKTCAFAPLFDNGVPKGFSVWRTSDLYTSQRISYKSISDIDLTIYLSNKIFGANGFVDDDIYLGKDFEDKVEGFNFFPVDFKGRLQINPVSLFVFETSMKQPFMLFLKNNLLTSFGVAPNLTPKTTQEFSAYSGNKELSVKKANYTWSIPNSKSQTVEHLYLVDQGKTTLLLMTTSDDVSALESILNNMHITKIGAPYKNIVADSETPLSVAKKSITASIAGGEIKDPSGCIAMQKKYLSSLSLADINTLTASCHDAVVNKISENQAGSSKQSYSICGKSYVFQKVGIVKGVDLLARFSTLSNLRTVPKDVCSDFQSIFSGKEIGVNQKEYGGANFLNFYPLYDKTVLDGQNTSGIGLAFVWNTNVVNYFPSTLVNGDATYIGDIK